MLSHDFCQLTTVLWVAQFSWQVSWFNHSAFIQDCAYGHALFIIVWKEPLEHKGVWFPMKYGNLRGRAVFLPWLKGKTILTWGLIWVEYSRDLAYWKVYRIHYSDLLHGMEGQFICFIFSSHCGQVIEQVIKNMVANWGCWIRLCHSLQLASFQCKLICSRCSYTLHVSNLWTFGCL